jgi:intein/homing endonuclease
MIKKTAKTEQMLEILRQNFTDEDYKEYILGNLKMKDVYEKYEVNQNAMDYFFAEKGYIKRSTLRKENIKIDIFNPVNTPEAAYILGFYIADGCLNGNKFVITLNEKDKEILEKIRDYMSPITKLIYKKETINKQGIVSHPMYSFAFACKEIVNCLENLGLGKNKTYLSKSIKNIVPRELMWDFIRGYWDGDGCISSSNVIKNVKETSYNYINIGFTIISKDPDILNEMNEFFIEEGINTHVYPDNKGNYLIGTHSKSEVEKIYNKLYTSSNLFMERKRTKFNEIMATSR